MQVFTEVEITAWRTSYEIPESPYSKSSWAESGFYRQASIPSGALAQNSFCQSTVHALMPFESAVLHITDWAHYTPEQMAVVIAIRSSCGECRRLIDASGHFFQAGEIDLLVGMFSLSISYGWSAYLYTDNGSVLLNWEGELLDVWLPEKSNQTVLEVFDGYKNGRD